MTNEKLLSFPEKDARLEKVGKKSILLGLKFQNPIVTAFVDCWDPKLRQVKLHFGKDLYGYISEEDFADEILKYKDGMPVQVKQLLKKKIIACVVSYDETNDIFKLNRKKTMKQARDLLEVGKEVNARIVNTTKRSIFADVGAGVIGRITMDDFSICPYKSLICSGFEKGDNIKVKIMEKSDDKVVLSRRKCYPNYHQRKEELSKEKKVMCFITKVFPSDPNDSFKNSYYAEVEPNVAAILNTDKRFDIGELVEAKVSAVKRRGLKLNI